MGNNNTDFQHQNPNQNPYTYYQNLYNMFGGYNPVIDKQVQELRRMSVMGGLTLLGFVLMQYVFLFLLTITGLRTQYINDTIIQLGINAIAPILYVLLPFAVLFCVYKPEEKQAVMQYDKPHSSEGFVLAVFAGLMICFVGNFATNYISIIFSLIGVEFTNPETDIPTNITGYILLVLGTAFIPALLEEFAFRGVVMQPLRKFGDKFAIIISSFLFAIMHGNMVQIPFAFVAGLALGYFAITTGSIWTSVVIHFLNNLFSVIISTYYDQHPDASQFPYYVFTGAIMIIGIVAIAVYLKSDHIKLKKEKTDVGKGLLGSTYICTPMVVIAIVYAMYSTLLYTEINRASGAFTCLVILILITFSIIRPILAMKRDNRIKQNSMYTASIVIMSIVAVIGTFMIVFTATSGLNSGIVR